MIDTTERWLPIKGFEGLYEVSSLARVRSVDRIVQGRNRWGPFDKHLRGKILAQHTDDYGYLVVSLSRDGKARPYRVHRLVGEAFFGPLPPGMDTRHLAGQQANAVTDICYGTRAENEQDKIRDGTFNHGGGRLVGEAHPRAKLTWAIVRAIRSSGESQASLARRYDVSQANISNIIRGRIWVDQAASPS